MNNIKLLDCTLRDGAYIVDSKFGIPAIKGIIKKCQEANIDIIECGWLKDKMYVEGTSFFHTPDDIIPYIVDKNEKATYVVMIDWDRYNLDYLPQYDGNSIDAVRVVFPKGKFCEGIEVGRKIAEKGYRVFFQAANTLAYSDDELVALAKEANKIMPVSLSVVDTFGAMYEEDLDRIVKILDKELDDRIDLGFHSHNNQQLAFSNTVHFIKMLQNSVRGVVVDASLCGMGRGAGNATTELAANYLNRKYDCSYDMNAIMDAIDTYMEPYKQNFEWGYSTSYFLAGMYCCHVNNIAYLRNNHRANARDIHNILDTMSEEDRIKYDYDLLEQKYLDNNDKKIDDERDFEYLKNELKHRKVLLIAPGKSSIEEQQKILKFSKDNSAFIIGVNAIIPGYSYDYIFFVNSARYEYASMSHSNIFDNTKKILLSNIKVNADSDEKIISYNRVIKRGWEHFDNAMIVALRMCDKLGVNDIAIAGFDGFKTQYNESYADELLPTLNPNGKWDELNEEIREMYQNFVRTKNNCDKIEFVTDSIFE